MGRNTNYYGIRFDRRSQNFGFHMIAQSQLIANDRRRSQKLEHGSIFCDRLRSSAITIARSQTIAEVCFHMIADDRRTFCDLRSAIVCDHMETSLKSQCCLSLVLANNALQRPRQVLQTCVRRSECYSISFKLKLAELNTLKIFFFFGHRSFIRGKTQTALTNTTIKRMLENKIHQR